MKKIAQLNDAFRRAPNRLFLAGELAHAPAHVQELAVKRTISFTDFNRDYDPHDEHDFGAFDIGDRKVFWKIDCYADESLTMGSENPSDPARTTRVLTIFYASDY